jgi:hypothetical protein
MQTIVNDCEEITTTTVSVGHTKHGQDNKCNGEALAQCGTTSCYEQTQYGDGAYLASAVSPNMARS